MILSPTLSKRDQASAEFGHHIHCVAVCVKRNSKEKEPQGKSELGRRIGEDKAIIKKITGGLAYTQDRVILERLVEAVQPEIDPYLLRRLHELVQEIHPPS